MAWVYFASLLCIVSINLNHTICTILGDDTFIAIRAIECFLDSGRIEYNIGEPHYIYDQPYLVSILSDIR